MFPFLPIFPDRKEIIVGSNPGRTSLLTSLLVLIAVLPASAVVPAQKLLPDSTCLYVSFPDVQSMRTNFKATQLGQLVADPVMKPFAEDLVEQLRDRFSQTDVELGLKWDDLEGVFAGEVCLARTLPGRGEHAVMLLIDVTNQDAALKKLRETLARNMQKRNATSSKKQIGSTQVTRYQLPKKEVWEIKPRETYFAVVQDQVVVTNHEGLATDVITHAEGNRTAAKRLESVPTFREVMGKVEASAGNLKPDIRWYVDPFQLADVVRNSRLKRKRNRNIVAILRGQGFSAIRGIGGHINFSANDLEVIHRTFVFAPPVTNQPTKFNGAARVLNFPPTSHLPVPKWVPRELATMTSLNWNVLNGFNYSTALIDQVVNSPGFVEDVLSSFETDKNGPQINIRMELLAHLDDHILTFSDYELPITTKSERILAAIRIKEGSEKAVSQALKQLWKGEPDARAVEIGQHVVWEIVPEEAEDLSDIDLPGAIPLPGGDLDDGGGGDDLKLPNAAMTVARGADPNSPAYLMVATNISLLKKVLAKNRPPHETLGASVDFQYVNETLNKMGAGKDSLRFFSRTDEEYRSAYEMIRMGKMPESESLLGRVLNRMLGPQEKNVIRKPEIDGRKMPDFQVVRRYLGPAGVFMTPEADGWSVTGIMVSKETMAKDGPKAKLTTAFEPGLGKK